MTQEASSGNRVGWSFLWSRRWLGYYAMLLVFAIACVLLSNWQFARRDEARAEIARIAHNYDAQPIALDSVVKNPARFDEDRMKWLPVTVTGRYVGKPVFIRNRPGSGGVGFDIAQAFRTDSGRVLLVNRGWVIAPDASGDTPGSTTGSGHHEPLTQRQISAMPLADTSTQRKLTVRLRASEPTVPGRSSTAHTAGSFHVPELARLAGLKGHPTYSAMYGMLVVESPAAKHGELPERPEKDEGPHFSYALQWLVFILIAGFGIGYAARQEFRHFNRESAQVQAHEAKRQRRRERRGPSDADEEDAWLESH